MREIRLTADGSHTIAIPEMNVTYHSHHGALAESRHVYIDAGLHQLLSRSTDQPVKILEIGFGTGLNALLSLQEAIAHKRSIHYTAIDTHPLTQMETAQINHGKMLSLQEDFLQLHHSPWEEDIRISEYFTLKKMNVSLLGLNVSFAPNCIYFDAFSPTVQPELWTQPVFEKLYRALAPGGILVTYCSKSEIRRSMTSAGFSVTKIPGPYGKREMVRAEK